MEKIICIIVWIALNLTGQISTQNVADQATTPTHDAMTTDAHNLTGQISTQNVSDQATTPTHDAMTTDAHNLMTTTPTHDVKTTDNHRPLEALTDAPLLAGEHTAVVALTCSFTKDTYNQQFSNTSSKEYIAYTNNIFQKMKPSLAKQHLRLIQIKFNSLNKGSVVANMNLVMGQNSSTDGMNLLGAVQNATEDAFNGVAIIRNSSVVPPIGTTASPDKTDNHAGTTKASNAINNDSSLQNQNPGSANGNSSLQNQNPAGTNGSSTVSPSQNQMPNGTNRNSSAPVQNPNPNATNGSSPSQNQMPNGTNRNTSSPNQDSNPNATNGSLSTQMFGTINAAVTGSPSTAKSQDNGNPPVASPMPDGVTNGWTTYEPSNNTSNPGNFTASVATQNGLAGWEIAIIVICSIIVIVIILVVVIFVICKKKEDASQINGHSNSAVNLDV